MARHTVRSLTLRHSSNNPFMRIQHHRKVCYIQNLTFLYLYVGTNIAFLYLAHLHAGLKRAAEPPGPSGAKRARTRAGQPSRQQAQSAAASIPPTYCADPHYETSLARTRASRATDCWLFVVGTHYSSMPASEELSAMRLADEARANHSTVDLRRPHEPRLRCIECLKLGLWRTWKNDDEGGVSYAIRNHLQKQHTSAYKADCDRIGYKTEGLDLSEEVNEPVTPQGILKYLVEWFAEDDISFSTLAHRGFRRFFSYIAQGNASTKDIPDRHTVATHVDKLCQEEKERIRKEIKHAPGRISCTADLWSDESQRSFMCITAHFYGPLKKMVDYLIAFRVIEGSHAGANLAEVFFGVLKEFGIVGKLGTFTLDNASNNDTFMAQMEQYMQAQNMKFERNGNRIRCFPHVINIAVQTVIQKLAKSALVFQSVQASAGISIHPDYRLYLNSLLSGLVSCVRTAIAAMCKGQRCEGFQKTIQDGNQDRLFYTHKWIEGVWTKVQQNL
ncbi:RNA-directed RNA polymerase L [Ceratobasidium sp. AG-Ba]|nr:RNA-directed RNA polymerase L [Ceratobasidium sp. AG-Ba]